MAVSMFGLTPYLRRLKDPRVNRRKRHLLGDILTMALCAVIGNAETWEEIATFARCRREWFQGFLQLPHGVPSAHTFQRVFDRLNPPALQRVLLDWLHHVSDLLSVRHIAIDGKTLRGSARQAAPNQYLHFVSAWATDANLTLGQVAVEEKSHRRHGLPEGHRPSEQDHCTLFEVKTLDFDQCDRVCFPDQAGKGWRPVHIARGGRGEREAEGHNQKGTER